MNKFKKKMLDSISNSYKYIKHKLYRIFIFTPQYYWWIFLRWYYKNIFGGLTKMRELALGKFLTYIGIIFLLLAMLKHTEFILYDPYAYDIPLRWPRRIKTLRKLALVHWISCILIYTSLHVLSWLNWRIHEHFKVWGQTMYYDLWFWYSMWYHGIFWTAVERYLNYGAGWTGLFYFTLVNHFLFLVCWGGEFMEELEYDWDDFYDSYEGALKDKETGEYYLQRYTEDTKDLLRDREQTILDSITWDIFGTSLLEDSEDPDKVHERWYTWDLLMYPPLTNTEEENWEQEFQSYVSDQPHDTWEGFLEEAYVVGVDPIIREWWWEYWTNWHDEYFIHLIYPWFSPLKNWYRTNLRPFHITREKIKIRAVGEYSRYNWRYKAFLMRFEDIPPYEGFGEYSLAEIIALGKFVYYLFRAIFLYWLRGLKYSKRDWKAIWFRKKYGKQVEDLEKWGSDNYSFFKEKDYEPKK